MIHSLTYIAEAVGVIGLIVAPLLWLLSGAGTAPAVPAEHRRTYRSDISDWWCVECDTVTDFCQELNPH